MFFPFSKLMVVDENLSEVKMQLQGQRQIFFYFTAGSLWRKDTRSPGHISNAICILPVVGRRIPVFLATLIQPEYEIIEIKAYISISNSDWITGESEKAFVCKTQNPTCSSFGQFALILHLTAKAEFPIFCRINCENWKDLDILWCDAKRKKETQQCWFSNADICGKFCFSIRYWPHGSWGERSQGEKTLLSPLSLISPTVLNITFRNRKKMGNTSWRLNSFHLFCN